MISVKMNRKQTEYDPHVSETECSLLITTYEIGNEGTIDDLACSAKYLLTKIGYK
jgi:hypothetical protein